MGTEKSSAFEEMAKIEAEKKESAARSLQEAAASIADMVEGNRILGQRADAAKEEQGYRNSPYDRERSLYTNEIGELRTRKDTLETTIKDQTFRLDQFKDDFKDDLDSYTDLLRRAEQEIQTLQQELEGIPQKEQEIIAQARNAEKIHGEMEKAYAKIESDNEGDGIRFAVQTTLEQMQEAGTPIGIDQDTLERAVSHELNTREKELKKERLEREDRDRKQAETEWLDELEKTLAAERLRIEAMIEDKAKFLRQETPEGKQFFADIDGHYKAINKLTTQWTFRDKSRERAHREILDHKRAIEKMLKSDDYDIRHISQDIFNSWRDMADRPLIGTQGGYSNTVMGYPRNGAYEYHSDEVRKEMLVKVQDLQSRITAFKSEMDDKVKALRPLLTMSIS